MQSRLVGLFASAGLVLVAGCGSAESRTAPDAAGSGGAPGVDAGVDASDDVGQPDAPEDSPAEADAEVHTGPTPAFDRFCSNPWGENLQQGFVAESGGAYLGVYKDLPVGTLETMKVIPPHPFQVRKLRVAFGGGTGTAKIRLMKSFGRSYPDIDNPEGDLVPPVELEVASADSETWFEIDVEPQNVFLEPTQHYVLVYEHLADQPYLAVEEIPEGEQSRALMLVPGESVPYGSDGNFRMQLEGDFFCAWPDAELWFGKDTTQPFVETASQRAAVTDLDGDGHDDIVLNAGGPKAWLGDGTGAFAEPGFDPFPDVPKASMLVFGDLDNDGDEDAFAGTYVSADADGDGWTLAEGDCNDTSVDARPGKTEIADNGVDEDCDGIADDGTSTADTDADGVTIAAGDCDDTREDVSPGAPELLDSRDNDCDLAVDEDFAHRVLLNDGTGRFTAVPTAGVEVLEPTAAAALGDGDGDGVLDVYWGNWLEHYPNPTSVKDRYFTGLGNGTFEDATTSSGVAAASASPCYGVLWNDFDNDGDQDIWVGNYGYGMNYLFRNDGTGVFTQAGLALGLASDGVGLQGGNTFGGDWGDIDNDGDLDMYAANIAHPRYQPSSDPSVMHVNLGAPDFKFEPRTAALGFVYDEGDVNAAFADFDNDMDLDLVVASLYPGHFSRLYRNDGAQGFVDVTYETGTAVEDAVSAVWSDIDEDGDLDLLIADRTGPQYMHLFVNRAGDGNRWVELVLQGTTTNRDGIGARVTLRAGGVTQIREVKGGGGHSNTQSTRVVHFGLANNASIEELAVRWVGGNEETITGVSSNGRFLIVQGTAAANALP